MNFKVANIRSDDAVMRAQANAFLIDNPDPGVRLRPAELVDRAMDTGQGLVVLDGDDIRGVSLVYQYDPGAGTRVDYEIGTMRVTAESFGLQTFLAQLHLVQIRLEDDTLNGDVFAVVTPGTASRHNLEHHVGMARWEPGDVLALLRRTAGVPFSPDKIVLRADGDAVARAFAGLAGLHQGGNRFVSPKKQQPIELALGWFDPQILEAGPGSGSDV